MDSQNARRGRPSGSGIDDSRRLREIAELITNDPDLKPTTAIKNIGISDPSIIRRLRDKFNTEREILLREASRNEKDAHRTAPQIYSHDEKARAMALKSGRDPVISEPAAQSAASEDDEDPSRSFDRILLATAATDSTPETPNLTDAQLLGDADENNPKPSRNDTASEQKGPKQADVVHCMFDIGLAATSAFFRLQIAIATQTIESPMTRSIMRYQIAASQALLGCPAPQSGQPAEG